jgi:hypothetical protein
MDGDCAIDQFERNLLSPDLVRYDAQPMQCIRVIGRGSQNAAVTGFCLR